MRNCVRKYYKVCLKVWKKCLKEVCEKYIGKCKGIYETDQVKICEVVDKKGLVRRLMKRGKKNVW